MPKITIELTESEYATLRKTQELMRIAGGAAETAEAYAAFVLKEAIASYAAQYPDDTPSAAEVAIYKDAAVRAEARASAEAEKAAAALSQVESLKAEQATAVSLAEQLKAL